MADQRPSTNENAFTRTVRVPHLGGIEVGYRISGPYKQYKPTLLLFNPFTTTSEIFGPQFEDKSLTDAMNLIAIEPLGHGRTQLRSAAIETFTFWDTAIMALQTLDALGVKKAFAAGTSQGGFIVTRLALLAPDRIEGIIPIGASQDYESERSRKLGCWDAHTAVTAIIDSASAPPGQRTDSFEPGADFHGFIAKSCFGIDPEEPLAKKWTDITKQNYAGDAGRKRLREASVNLRDRDGLHGRLSNVKVPVLWLHGDKDELFSVANAEEEIKLFVNSPSAELVVVPGAPHFAGAVRGQEINASILAFVTKFSKTQDARALREAVGMVEM